MTPILISFLVALVVVLASFVLLPRLLGDKDDRKKDFLNRISSETSSQDDGSILKSDRLSENDSLENLLKKIPGIGDTKALLKSSGLTISVGAFIVIRMVIFLVLFLFFGTILNFGPILGVVVAGLIATIGVKKYLEYKTEKRATEFLNQFPDAVDMIVRSVRSGHPLSTALKMIADNMDPPVSLEFKQVVDEVAYGRSVTDALNLMADRVDQTDVRFFVVVINVQQETGGNLGEVLSNLSGILRKRKQMRMKIHALTSEGRMTAYVLGSLPFFVMGILHLLSPDYLTPLFVDNVGRFILGLAALMVFAAFYISKKMVNIDI